MTETESPIKSFGIGNRRLYVYMIVLTSLLSAASSMYFLLIYDVFVLQLSSYFGGILFALLTFMSYVVGYLLLGTYAKQIAIHGRTLGTTYLRHMFNAVRIVFYVTAAVMAIILFQMVITSQYHVGLSLVIVILSYLLAAVNLGLVGYKMLSWFKVKRNMATLLIALTFLGAAVAYVNLPVVNSAYFFSVNPYQTEKYYVDYGFQLDPDAGGTTPHFSPRKSASLFELYQFTLNVTRIPYFIMWASAIALVRNYAKTMGRAKFLLITILPGLIFPIQIVESLVGIFPPLFASLYGSASLTLAGVFFGIIFFVSARAMKSTLGHDNAVSRYLTITGFGFILALTATSPAVHVIDRIHTPFPPFGALTWAFFGLAVYLVSSGFYLSAVSISQDVALRKSVRQVAAEESSKMLDTIGTAQMEQEIRRRVQKIAEEQQETLKEQTGIQQTISEEDVNTYVMNALEEVKKIHHKSD